MKSGIRELIFVLLLLALPASMYIMVFKPRVKSEIDMQEEIDAKTELINNIASKRITALANIDEDMTLLKKAAQDAKKRIPLQANEDDVMAMIAKLAKENGLTIERIQTINKPMTDEEQALPYRIQRITVTLTGDFPGVYSLLLSIEQSDRLIAINTIGLEKLPESDKQGKIKAYINLEIYYKPPVETAKAGGAK